MGIRGKPHKPPNKVIHFDDGVTVIALERKDGTVLPCYLDTVDYFYFHIGDYRWHAGASGKTFYASTDVDDGSITSLGMHQMLMGGNNFDHINRVGTDNRRQNLRSATYQQQSANTSLRSTNKTGVRGVCWNKGRGKYQAGIRLNGKQKHLGLFTTLVEASIVAAAAQHDAFGEYAA